MRWVHALVLIVAGLGLILAGGAQATRPTSDRPAKPGYIRQLNHHDSQVAELHQRLRVYDACEQAARTDPAVWDNWPCYDVRAVEG